MFAAVSTEKAREIDLVHQVIPQLEDEEVLIKVSFCGICGSDLHAYAQEKGYEFVDKPRILGHEIAGTVVKTANETHSDLVEKQVIIESMHYCGKCNNCQEGRYSICLNNKVIGLHYDGGMAEYVKVKAKYVKEVSDLRQEIAVLNEPMAVAVHAVDKVIISSKDIVLVQGPGIIGFFVALLCVERGAKVYISGLEKDYGSRLAKFSDFQMTPHVSEDGIIEEKADVIFECSGSNQAVKGAFKQIKKGGKAVFVALYEQVTDIFLTDLVRNEWPIITSYGCDPVDYEQALKILKKYDNRLKKLISYYPFEKSVDAFDDGYNQRVLKPVIDMQTM